MSPKDNLQKFDDELDRRATQAVQRTNAINALAKLLYDMQVPLSIGGQLGLPFVSRVPRQSVLDVYKAIEQAGWLSESEFAALIEKALGRS